MFLFLYFLEESISLFAAGDDMGGISLWRIYPKGPGTLGPKPDKNKNENKINRENKNKNKIENESKNENNNNNEEEEFIANVQETVRLQCFLNLNLLIRGNEKNERNYNSSTTPDNITELKR